MTSVLFIYIDLFLIPYRGQQSVCKHQTSTSCTWLEVDDEDSFISDVGYAMAVIYENTVFTPIKQYLGGKAVKVKTSEIGK